MYIEFYKIPTGEPEDKKPANAEEAEKKRLTTNDIYQLLVGEIGIRRHEFLYEIQLWEARRIIRRYRRRNVLLYQLQRNQIWASLFCMGNPGKKTPEDIFKLYFDDDDTLFDEPDDNPTPMLTEEERNTLEDEMRAFEEHLKGSEK